ncbi:transporter [Leptospira wolffii]|uniref:efflux RND transporter permease subunit n=1 Tax=Leptospira wolffii TaxID=409998 RepID=UPI001083EA29|nr:MMPL family transporter [Leptospira wolffii]TGK58781.1 transporter [Leptospira wolffii]TGK67550.1 transporter [Leptospira wolffii]TGK72689.1 transporter [Leptospira wolffii]TGL26880.1 transporter [Leptospira wolffii]
MRKILSKATELVLTKPVPSSLLLLIILGLSALFASRLSINSDNLQLLPSDNPSVIQTKRVIEMVGGSGFYTVALKFKDEKGMTEHLVKAFQAKRDGNAELQKKELELADQEKKKNAAYYKSKEIALKNASERLAEALKKETDLIRFVSYRYNVTFLQDRLPLFLKTEDLVEVRRRVKRKIDEEIEKANPFFIKLTDEEYNPDFTDIVSKYQKLAKRDIFDEYNISPDKGMLILLAKPTGSFVDIQFLEKLDKRVQGIVESLDLGKDGVYAGYTGAYKLNQDDYETLLRALKPIGIASLLGIALLLLLFFRNPLFIVILLFSLASGLLMTFGLTGLAIGQLNSITSIIGSILMGLGIDYGIQFLYRFREEFTKKQDIVRAIKDTIYHTGIASFSSALTTTSAFVVLSFSDFRGFSEFGIIATYGTIIIALAMYGVTALQIALLLKWFPGLSKYFLLNEAQQTPSGLLRKFYSRPGILAVTVMILVLAFGVFAPKVQFDVNGRNLLVENLESVNLYDEIADRFDISSDPQAIVVKTLEESEAVFDYLSPVPESIAGSVDQVVSLWNFVPPYTQQMANRKVLDQIAKDMKPVKAAFLKPEQRKYLPKAKLYLSVQPYDYKAVPDYFTSQFTEVATSKEKGHLLFLYPKVALWHGGKLLEFFAAVGRLEVPKISRRTLNTILYSTGIAGKGYIDPVQEKYSNSETKALLGALNSYSKEKLLSLKILPGTVDTILEHRPYKDIAQARSYTFQTDTAGSLMLFANLILIVQREGFAAFFITLALVVLVLILFYRAFLPAILSLIPLLLGIVVTIGLMALIDLKLNFMNVLVFPVVIGYGIQNGIYIYYRFREDHDIVKAIAMVGPAVIASTLTTLVGWSALLLADQRGLHSIGKVATIGIAACLLIALTLLPAILELAYRNRREEESEVVPFGLGPEEEDDEMPGALAFSQPEPKTVKPTKKAAPKKKSAAKKKSVKKK